ncbi:MAG: TIGR02996 domain-containing protein [Mariniblastus sp.]
MSSHEIFLSEIVNNPSNMDPRLVYADWLIEKGDPLGEFIQAQIELAGNCTAARKKTLSKIQKSLQPKLSPNNKLAKQHLRKPDYRMGFIEHATIGLQAFIDHGNVLCQQFPLRSVQLTAGSNKMDKLTECAHLKHIEHIDFRSNDFNSESVAKFANCEHLANLKSIHFRSSNFGEPGALAIANSKYLSNVESIEISNNEEWSNECMKVICESKTLSGLKRFRLEGSNNLTQPFCKHFASATFRENLQSLEFTFVKVGNSGLTELIRNSFPSLSTLLLNGCNLSGNGLAFLCKNNERLPSLTTLGLNFNSIDDRGAIALSKSELLAQLLDVRMSQNQLDFEGLNAIAKSPKRNKKTKFYLPKNPISGSQLLALIESHGNFGKFDSR